MRKFIVGFSKYTAFKRLGDSSHKDKPLGMIAFDLLRTSSEAIGEFCEANALDFLSHVHGYDRIMNKQIGGTGRVQDEGCKQYTVYGFYWGDSEEARVMSKKDDNTTVDFTRQGKKPIGTSYSLNLTLIATIIGIQQFKKGLNNFEGSVEREVLEMFMS